MEKSGELFTRVWLVFNGVTAANLNPELQKVQDYEAPRLAALQDDLFLDSKLFQRVAKLYRERDSLIWTRNRFGCSKSNTRSSCTRERTSATPIKPQ